MTTPIERVAALTIGTVESVTPSEIRVLLDTDAPQATALNTGAPIGFPRINGYILIPNETGAVVGMIVWLGVERSAFPKRTGLKDFGLIDLPFPLRKLALTPLGTLVQKRGESEGRVFYKLKRGVAVFPSVGDPALLPTVDQLKSIIEASEPADLRVYIGTSPLASDARVTVDPNKIFGRHLAVLGNTGSGKSCSVAGLIRWSLEEAKKKREKDGRDDKVNARFIILDPNGEYATAFDDLIRAKKARVFRVPPVEEGYRELSIPAWMWNSQEWCAFAQASPGVQRPLLQQALRDMRAGQALAEPIERRVSRLFRSYKTILEGLAAQGAHGYSGFPANKNCGTLLDNIAKVAGTYAEKTQGSLSAELDGLRAVTETTVQQRHWSSPNSEGYNDFNEAEIQNVLNAINSVLSDLPSSSQSSRNSEDAPVSFNVDDLPDHLDMIASEAPGGQTAQFVATLSMRIRMMLADQRLGPVVNPEATTTRFFLQWLEEYVGADNASNGQLAILDLSLVPTDVLHMIIAVIARIVFEATQRYRRVHTKELPTVLVLEEAHTFIRRGSDQDEGNPTPVQMCRQTFERIAREGRKFGLGLVLSSQRPSELSPTALAQCNTFLLHRIVNDRDQELVSKLVPDNLGGLLKELPSLPSKQAILLGWAAEVPTLVEIRELEEKYRPRSSDPEFWKVWTGEEERSIDWKPIVQEWTGLGQEESSNDGLPDVREQPEGE